MKRILLSILLMLCLLPAALAEGPDVFVEEGAEGVPQEVIDRLAADYPDAGAITITALHTGSPAPSTTIWPFVLSCAVLLCGAAGLLVFRYKRLHA